jgi:formate dehydrogenase iron-sulfur subunit
MSYGLLFDGTLCIGCQECEAGCAQTNGLPWNEEMLAEAKASDRKYTFIKTVDGDKYMRHLCMHCEDPSCASVCPVGAFTKTAAGPVIYDESKCMGCRYCMVACPFGVPKYEWGELIPGVRKCTGCYERVTQGLSTACAEACPTGATISGERDALIAEAKRRLAENPDGYYPHVFGIDEVGGTSTIFLSAVPFDRFGLKSEYPSEPLPKLTYDVLSKIPNVVTVGFVLLGGVWWITNRRDEVAKAEAKDLEIK